jgi:23S rRNA (pseudouridine1915-N3)-methyltransferase
MKIIAVGKTEKDFAKLIADYEKRLPKNWAIDWKIIPYSAKSGDEARREETAKIREKLAPEDFVILLDERGREFSSPEFSRKITSVMETKNLTFVIGGAYGVAEDFRGRPAAAAWLSLGAAAENSHNISRKSSDFTLSFGKMVLPHQIARLVLTEQIYRALAISRNHPYHHE